MRRDVETNPVIPLHKTKLGIVRENRHMSKGKLSREAEVHMNVISWAESGRFIPYEAQMVKIARALEWPTDRESLAKLLEPVEV